MAIPKQPRQLMINIMYLVLTALLALNVSAEIFNAFKMVDKGLKESNAALDQQIQQVQNQVEKTSTKREEFAKYAENLDPLSKVTSDLTNYIDDMVNTLIDEAGNDDGKVNEEDYVVKGSKRDLKGKKNKDVTTRMLINEGKGAELKQKILEAQAAYIELVDSNRREEFMSELALKIDDESWKLSKDKNSWAEFNFKQMPLQACLPIFTKFKNDAKATEVAILNQYASIIGGEDVVFDKFQVFSSPTKAYIIKGEKFETKISLGAATGKSSKTDIDIAVNGSNLTVGEDGSATWTTVPSSTGIKTYNAKVVITNPVTGEETIVTEKFEFEVGERSCNVSAEKMNVFYIGVDNPVAVSAAGVSSNDLKVSATGSGINLSKKSAGKYNATVQKPGETNITVSGGGLQPTKFTFRVKRIPDPVAKLSKYKGGPIASGIFKAQQGVIPVLENFDFDAKCNIMGFQLVRIAKRQDAEIALNRGNRFQGDAAGLVSKAKPGDRYFFENVKAKCPGDAAGRPINDMVFTIK